MYSLLYNPLFYLTDLLEKQLVTYSYYYIKTHTYIKLLYYIFKISKKKLFLKDNKSVYQKTGLGLLLDNNYKSLNNNYKSLDNGYKSLDNDYKSLDNKSLDNYTTNNDETINDDMMKTILLSDNYSTNNNQTINDDMMKTGLLSYNYTTNCSQTIDNYIVKTDHGLLSHNYSTSNNNEIINELNCDTNNIDDNINEVIIETGFGQLKDNKLPNYTASNNIKSIYNLNVISNYVDDYNDDTDDYFLADIELEWIDINYQY